MRGSHGLSAEGRSQARSKGRQLKVGTPWPLDCGLDIELEEKAAVVRKRRCWKIRKTRMR